MTLLTNKISDLRLFRSIILLGSLGAVSSVLPIALAGEPGNQGVRLTYSLQTISQTTPTADPNCPLKVLLQGAGLTNLVGPVHDEQSHCVQADGTIDHGAFTFTGAALGGGQPGGDDSGDSISGQYRAHSVPTFASQLSNPPGGFWLIYGEVCTWKGTGKFAGVIDDCPTATSPGRFVPARGTVDFNTGQATIFGTMVVRFKDAD